MEDINLHEETIELLGASRAFGSLGAQMQVEIWEDLPIEQVIALFPY